jgi:hypothetical protein
MKRVPISKTRGIECRPAPALRAGIAVQQLTASDALKSQHRYYDFWRLHSVSIPAHDSGVHRMPVSE